VRFQVLTTASMQFRVFWDVAPCSYVEVDRCFRGAYYLQRPLPWWWRQYAPLKRRSTLTWLHCAISQKTLHFDVEERCSSLFSDTILALCLRETRWNTKYPQNRIRLTGLWAETLVQDLSNTNACSKFAFYNSYFYNLSHNFTYITGVIRCQLSQPRS
jgi:hypothetical protein